MKPTVLLFLFLVPLAVFAGGPSPDSLFLTGKIANLAKKTGQVLTVSRHELAFDDDVNFIAKIGSDGTFSIHIPLDHATEIRMEAGKSAYIYGRPGTSLIVNWDDLQPDETMRFAGEDAALNQWIKKYNKELKAFRNLRGNYNSRYAVVEHFPDDYKKFEYENLERDLRFYEEFIKLNPVSDFFKKLKKYEIEYNCAANLMRYRWNRPKGVKLPAGYFDFFERFKPDNRDALISPLYTGMYLHECVMFLSEKINREADSTGKVSVKEKDRGMSFYATGILESPELTAAERARWELVEKIPAGKKAGSADSLFFVQFANSHTSLLMEKFPPPDPVIDYCLTQPDGLLRNVQLAHELYMMLDAEYPQMAKQYMAAFAENVSDAGLTGPILNLYNEKVRKLTNYVPNANAHLNTPLTGAIDSLFQALTGKYRGNVIYIDFWATWCGPCKEEIPISQQLKKELAGKPVTFLYLGVESPENTWKALIANLKIDGEHYLLRANEYKLLANRFQVNGIPHYVLVDKKGTVVNGNAARPSSSELKRQIINLSNQ